MERQDQSHPRQGPPERWGPTPGSEHPRLVPSTAQHGTGAGLGALGSPTCCLGEGGESGRSRGIFFSTSVTSPAFSSSFFSRLSRVQPTCPHTLVTRGTQPQPHGRPTATRPRAPSQPHGSRVPKTLPGCSSDVPNILPGHTPHRRPWPWFLCPAHVPSCRSHDPQNPPL